ncbi:hypothetical protein C0J52_09985 [Blattella germanica]|nr:hypothetical protein C0J52_09985 [Blattella germanica]
MLSFILATVLLLLSLTLFLKKLRRPPNFPPGPKWLPVVGNFPDLKKMCREKKYMHEALAALAKAHDTEVLGLKLGSDLTIVVFGHKYVREVFTKEEYDGRPDSFFIRLRAMGGRRGITFTDGRYWHEQRSFAVRHLREVGFGKTQMEDMILDELRDLLKLFGEQKGCSVSMGLSFAPSVLNVLWVLSTGSRFSSRDDPRLHRLLHALKARSKAFDMAVEQLIMICMDFFIAGAQTTSTTLDFVFLMMLLYPEVQRKAYEQLVSVVGCDRLPTNNDRSKYDTTVLMSMWSVHYDKAHWGDPEVFRPERHINEKGELISDEWLMPFGLGEALKAFANTTLFFYNLCTYK